MHFMCRYQRHPLHPENGEATRSLTLGRRSSIPAELMLARYFQSIFRHLLVARLPSRTADQVKVEQVSDPDIISTERALGA